MIGSSLQRLCCDQVTPRTHMTLPPVEVSCASLGDVFVFTAVPRGQGCEEALTEGLVERLCLSRLLN